MGVGRGSIAQNPKDAPPAASEPGNIRINYSAGRKLSHPRDRFGSYDFHVSFSSDLLPGETPDEAFARAAEFVERKLRTKGRAVRRETLEY